jgi:hypothetical protein
LCGVTPDRTREPGSSRRGGPYVLGTCPCIRELPRQLLPRHKFDLTGYISVFLRIPLYRPSSLDTLPTADCVPTSPACCMTLPTWTRFVTNQTLHTKILLSAWNENSSSLSHETKAERGGKRRVGTSSSLSVRWLVSREGCGGRDGQPRGALIFADQVRSSRHARLRRLEQASEERLDRDSSPGGLRGRTHHDKGDRGV